MPRFAKILLIVSVAVLWASMLPLMLKLAPAQLAVLIIATGTFTAVYLYVMIAPMINHRNRDGRRRQGSKPSASTPAPPAHTP